MALDIASDLDVMFDVDFGQGRAATFSAAGPWNPVSVTVIFDKPQEANESGILEVVAAMPRALVRASELPEIPDKAELQIGTEYFHVTKAELDETGHVWTLALRPKS